MRLPRTCTVSAGARDRTHPVDCNLVTPKRIPVRSASTAVTVTSIGGSQANWYTDAIMSAQPWDNDGEFDPQRQSAVGSLAISLKDDINSFADVALAVEALDGIVTGVVRALLVEPHGGGIDVFVRAKNKLMYGDGSDGVMGAAAFGYPVAFSATSAMTDSQVARQKWLMHGSAARCGASIKRHIEARSRSRNSQRQRFGRHS